MNKHIYWRLNVLTLKKVGKTSHEAILRSSSPLMSFSKSLGLANSCSLKMPSQVVSTRHDISTAYVPQKATLYRNKEGRYA